MLYYGLKQPFTHLKVEHDHHDRIWVWVNHANVGKLTVLPNETTAVVMAFADVERPVMRRHGVPGGVVVKVSGDRLWDNEIVISGDGEVLTVREVKDQQNAFLASHNETGSTDSSRGNAQFYFKDGERGMESG